MKIVTALVFSILVGVTGCTSSNDETDAGSPSVEALAIAYSEWESFSPDLQQMACAVFVGMGDAEDEDILEMMTTGVNKVSMDVAVAKLQMLKKEC